MEIKYLTQQIIMIFNENTYKMLKCSRTKLIEVPVSGPLESMAKVLDQNLALVFGDTINSILYKGTRRSFTPNTIDEQDPLRWCFQASLV